MPANPFLDALYSFYGAARTTPIVANASLASASGEGTITGTAAGYLWSGYLYGITYSNKTANSTMDWRIIDASATGNGGVTALFQLGGLAVGTDSLVFPRPIKFDKGLQYLACATGASGPQLYVHWDAINRYDTVG